MHISRYLKAYTRVCRMEYLLLEAPGVFFPLFLAATSLHDLLNFQVVEALMIFMLLFCGGFMTNALADIEVDSKYKTRISNAVRALGKNTLVALIIIHFALALLLTFHISHIFGNYWLIAWVSTAIFFVTAYSVKPFHFKVGGLLYFSLMIFPFIMVSLVYYVVGGTPSIPVIFIILSFLTAHQGIELVNQAQDCLDDRECGLKTPSARWGITRTLKASLVTTLTGVVLVTIGFYIIYSNLPDLVIHGTPVSFKMLFIVTVIILVVAYYVPVKGTWKFIKISLADSPEEHKIALIRQQLNYPVWQLTGVLGGTSIAALYFLWKIYCRQ